MCEEDASSKEWVWLLACKFDEPLEEGVVYFLAAKLGNELVIVNFAIVAGRDVPRSDDLCILCEGEIVGYSLQCMESRSGVEGDVRVHTCSSCVPFVLSSIINSSTEMQYIEVYWTN